MAVTKNKRVWLNNDPALTAYAQVSYERGDRRSKTNVSSTGRRYRLWATDDLDLTIADCRHNVTIDFSGDEKPARAKLAKLRLMLDLVEAHLDDSHGAKS